MLVNLTVFAAILAIWVAALLRFRRPLPDGSPIAEATDRRVQRVLIVLTIIIGGVGVVPFAGMPGFLWLEVAAPLGRLACPGRAWGDFQSGVSWPAAILMTPMWALSFLPAYRVARLATSRGRLVATIAGAVGLVALAGIGLAIFFYVLGCTW